MKPSERAKQAGLKSLTEMGELSGWTPEALRKMYARNREQFETLLHGAVSKKSIKALARK
jgi:hypothetical protein